MTPGQTVIDGRFQLKEQLGRGGMGTVWRALDLALEREVALKEVRLTETDDAERNSGIARMRRERVMREARALARLDHPNVVTIHHIVDSPELPHPWLVMELVRGQSLQDRLAEGRIPPGEAAAIGRGILAALAAAHQAGIRHRDVKPANVLLRMDGTPVLTDFGIAVLEDASRVTATGGLVGSPEYIAPERLHGREGDPASDLWSLGVLLYVAVEGHNPLRRSTTAATLAAVMAGQIPPPRNAGPLAPVLQALLVRDPAARPTTAQLDQMLAQAAGTGGAQPTPAPMSAPMSAPMQGPQPSPVPGPTTNPNAPFPNGPHTAPPPVRRRRSATVPVVLGVLAVGTLATVLAAIFIVVPRVVEGFRLTITETQAPVDTVPSASKSTTLGNQRGGGAAQGGTLLTPAAIRDVIKKFEAASGSKLFAQFAVYEQRANADAPVPGRRSAFDNYTYERGADAAVRSRPSIAITTGNAKVDLNTFNWDALPSLMRRAERTLRVPKPTSRYILVRAAWVFNGNRPTMMIYFTDEYDGGYLAVNTKGQVVSTHPADS
ncbi:hypothetical protein Acsp03_55740 [Actinomadura sp. NBRC 104412]|uniref:serine/threonine-protein kinase n=1 Tax=Actinomadura sp. NBRC 104412 TaxID=3032203 RepID=UPI0024A3C7D2|nr:serine/threonine protein kinase [Actinomadura sp. NBRC 104412]GLZ08108.1 hypothetical protein Acsp03_55740 [Actinomadura sp. NBRC 104412]